MEPTKTAHKMIDEEKSVGSDIERALLDVAKKATDKALGCHLHTDDRRHWNGVVSKALDILEGAHRI
jgi:hypothetical protein